MKNRKLLLIVSIVLALTMSLGGTLAYLTDTDADVNTMVLGNVQIVQNEQEWNAGKTELKEFTQDKPLLPYVGELGWENKDDQGGAYRRFTMNNVVDKYVTVTNKGNTNAYVRTIIALEMGDYNYDEFKMIGISNNAENGSEFKFPGAWVWTDDYAAEIDGHNYNIMVAVHQDPLAAKETTIPSLLQVYLSKDADNEDVQKLDGNKNGKYDILVISQAVQADGFGSAAEALEAGFGKVTANERETVASWFASIGDPDSDYQIGSPNTDPETGKNDTNNPPIFYDHIVSTSEALEAAFAEGGNIKLTADIELEGRLNLKEGDEVYLDLNGKTITANNPAVDPFFYTYKNSTLTIAGNGKVEIKAPFVSLIFPGGDVVIENGTFVRNVPADTPAKEVGAFFVGAKVDPWGSQTLTINGGYFDGGYYDENAADIEEILAGTKEFSETADDIAKRGLPGDANKVRVALQKNVQKNLNLSSNLIKVYGGTFVGMNPAWGDEGCMLPTTPNYLRPWSYYQGAMLDGQTFNENGIVLPDGYTITMGTTADGRPTYTVNYSK